MPLKIDFTWPKHTDRSRSRKALDRPLRQAGKLCLIVAALNTGGLFITGCQNGNQMSEKDLAQVKQGPPKEMPAEAYKVMQEARQKSQAQSQAPPTK
jgi:hypothetical protein